jgi:hypothetical protein
MFLYDILSPLLQTTYFPLSCIRWTKKGNLSCFIRRTCPSHLNPSLIIALENKIEPQFSHSLLFDKRSVSQVPKTILRQFLWKKSSKSSSAFRSAHASEPYLTTVNTVASNILFLVCRLIFLFFEKNLNCLKTLWSLAILLLTSLLLPPSLLIILPK